MQPSFLVRHAKVFVVVDDDTVQMYTLVNVFELQVGIFPANVPPLLSQALQLISGHTTYLALKLQQVCS